MRDKWNTSSLEIRWGPVPLYHRNGIIQGYKLKYRMTNEFDDQTLHPTKTLLLPQSALHVVLESLQTSAVYEVELLAYTAIGDGKATKLTGGL